MTSMERRRAMAEYCKQKTECASCPIAHYDRGHRCGKGLAFLLGDDRRDLVTDLEVLGAYTLAFPEEKEAAVDLQAPTVTLMNAIPGGMTVSIDSKQKISAINIMFQEDESE